MAPMGGNVDAVAPIVAEMTVVGRPDKVEWRPGMGRVAMKLCGGLTILMTPGMAQTLAEALEREVAKADNEGPPDSSNPSR